ncbi:MAG: hypothetical protein FWB88_12130 [Defluviitaleaceae bacterium]|nr:hypothetical protein [Defluviitaleaceae bacterium]MCL2240360.1 hypothetical protein [Defluviitaleaceae bacterium]
MSKTVTDIGPVMRNLKQLGQHVESVHDAVYHTDQNIQALLAGIESLTQAFHSFALGHERDKRVEAAGTRLFNIRNEWEEAFGAYEKVRKTAAQAMRFLENGEAPAAKALLASLDEIAPDYWLAASLSVVCAWLNDQPKAAALALKHSLALNHEKTTLFFIFICHKAARQGAALSWVRQYLAVKNPEQWDNNMEIILDAYQKGIFGTGDTGITVKFPHQATDWRARFDEMRPALPPEAFPFLQKYSPTWPTLKNAQQTARLHGVAFDFLSILFSPADTGAPSQQLSKALTALLTAYDDAELPLRDQARREQQIIDSGGAEPSPLPPTEEISPPHSPSRALAIAIDRHRVAEAYQDIIQSAYMPDEIIVNIGTFSAPITENNQEMASLDAYFRCVEAKKQTALQQIAPPLFERYGLYIGGFLFALGFILLLTGSGLIALFSFIIGLLSASNHFMGKKNTRTRHNAIASQYEGEREEGIRILRATLAEIHALRREIYDAQGDCEKVTDFIEGISLDPPAPKPTRGRKAKPLVPDFAKGLPPWDITP